jgi:hypothetical protein
MIEVRQEYIDTHIHIYYISSRLAAFAIIQSTPTLEYTLHCPITIQQSTLLSSFCWYTQALFSKDVKSLKGYGQGAETGAFSAGAEEDKTGEQEEVLIRYVQHR